MLAVGRALARQPKLLLLDELSLGLAPVIVEGLLPVVREYAEESGCGVVLVEQHIELALTIADRGYVLSHGEIVLQGAAEQLRTNHDLLISSYFGEHTDLFAGIGAGAMTRPVLANRRSPTRTTRSCAARSFAARSPRTPVSSSRTSVTCFDMSRGAVRNALIRLEQEGLVVREPHRGRTRAPGQRHARRSRSSRRAPCSKGSPSA